MAQQEPKNSTMNEPHHGSLNGLAAVAHHSAVRLYQWFFSASMQYQCVHHRLSDNAIM